MLHLRSLIAILSAFLGSQAAAQTDTLLGKVISITDGDTIQIRTADREVIKIRVSGIDAPEKNQPFGQRSKERMSALVFAKEVVVEARKIDHRGRTFGKVMVAPTNCRGCEKTIDAGLALIESGLAWHYKHYNRDLEPRDRVIYADAEITARKQGKGLWTDPDPLPPWDWRKTQRY